jgi:hypothetical protein
MSPDVEVAHVDVVEVLSHGGGGCGVVWRVLGVVGGGFGDFLVCAEVVDLLDVLLGELGEVGFRSCF